MNYDLQLAAIYLYSWTTFEPRENVPSDMCARRRFKSARGSAQSDQNLRCPHEETLHHWLSKIRPRKILIRLCECTVWSESSLGTHVRRYVFWRFTSFEQSIKLQKISGISTFQYRNRQFDFTRRMYTFVRVHERVCVHKKLSRFEKRMAAKFSDVSVC